MASSNELTLDGTPNCLERLFLQPLLRVHTSINIWKICIYLMLFQNIFEAFEAIEVKKQSRFTFEAVTPAILQSFLKIWP